MGLWAFLKVVTIPALISLALFLSLNYIIVPAIRKYRERYEQYLPLHSISERTSSIRKRIGDRLSAFILPRFYIERRTSIDGADELFGDDEGDDLTGFEIREIARRRAELRRQVGNMEDARRSSESFGGVR